MNNTEKFQDRLWYPQEHTFQTPAGTSDAFHRMQLGVTEMKASTEYSYACWRVKCTAEMWF